MIQDFNGITVIICDKCGKKDSASTDISGQIFFEKGWGLQPNAKKYIHLCKNCQKSKQRKFHDFVAAKFGCQYFV